MRFRLKEGGRIDRTKRLRFTFNARSFEGFAGDTLASALIANGTHLTSRSFKYHRPRGILTAGAEEPSALVQLGTGARTEPNLRATQVELYDGLTAQASTPGRAPTATLLPGPGGSRRSSPPASTTRPFSGRRRSGRRFTSPPSGAWRGSAARPKHPIPTPTTR